MRPISIICLLAGAAEAVTSCLTTKYLTASYGNASVPVVTSTVYNVTCNVSSPTVSGSTVIEPTYVVFTPAPWLATLPQTTVRHVETIVVSQNTVYRTFAFAVPAPSAVVCPNVQTVTVSIVSCPTASGSLNGHATTVIENGGTDGAGATQATTPIAAAAVAGQSPGESTQTRYVTSSFVTSYTKTITSLSIATETRYYTITGPSGATVTSSTNVQTVTITSTLVMPTTSTQTSIVTEVAGTGTAQGAPNSDPGSTGTVITVVTPVPVPASTTTQFTSVLYSNTTTRIVLSPTSYSAETAPTSVTGVPVGLPGAGGSTTLESTLSSTVVGMSSMSSESAAPSMTLSGATISSSSGTSMPISSSSSSSDPTSSSSSSSSSSGSLTLSASASSSSSIASCPIGTLAPSATAPAPPAGTQVYNLPGNPEYSISEADLLAMISFPNGFNCKGKLVILQPGTAVPAIDTFMNTFTPAFENAQTMAETGGVDIMMISNPSNSLAPAWKTAEYVAYALDYANLVLKRPGTIIAWSQGNLNVQWAFKYWPTTRTDVEGRNYVGISPDYDGTILADFLCRPLSILTDGNGLELADEFIAGGGLTTILQALGISTLPIDPSTGKTDPQAFKALLLSLVYGSAATNGFGSSSSSAITMSATSVPSTVSATLISSSSASPADLTEGTSTSASLSAPTDAPFKRRAVRFGDREDVVALLRERVEKRQTTALGALGTLLDGVSDSILGELAEIVVNPEAPLMQVFANLAKLATEPVDFSLSPQGCVPGVWDQTYNSAFVQKLAENGGDLAYVPTTTVFSITDEVVEPQGVTGETNASGFMSGSNPGVVAPQNIFIQGHCTAIGNPSLADVPPFITHEGALISGMGVSAAILAVITGSTVSYDQIVAAYGQSEACALLSSRNTAAEYAGNEATIPGAFLRITVNPGTNDPDAQFQPAPSPLPSYAA